ncbi:hypothetical protein CSC94_19955 [Zhengella mangrovi]|uniref:Uncharacterized protein n=1 Tax=Zhengella mangrovi TaxID=1982044 RepID=A0A2G1QIA4_9HYPH|nr:hypothetical protein [Zhengella mangrovi]PHP65190.1 hypothetical protein CSC94_19955 [Zhengella mangrovi]
MDEAVIDQLRIVFRRLEIVAGTWRAIRREETGMSETDVRDALIKLDPLWDELFPAEQGRIVHLLVERVTIIVGQLDIHLRADGLPSLARELAITGRAAP